MTQSSTSAAPLSASAFIDSIGINTHAGYAWSGYNNLSLMTQSLNYLGVTTLRDALTTLPQAQPVLTGLAAAGYKFDFIVSSSAPASGTSGITTWLKALDSFQAAHPGSIVAIEGLNEANIQKFSYNGSSSMTAAAQFQTALYAAVKADPNLKGVSVYNLTLGHNDAVDYKALGNLTGASDYANAHAYVSTNSTVTTALNTSLGLASASATSKPTVITETGYTTLAKTADIGANESAQAKSILNTLVTAFQDGVAKTYLYELLDRGNDPTNTDKEAHFGLFNADGSPKIAATAVHNLTTILADDGKGAGSPTGTLGYSVSNLPSSGSSMVLTKSNGAYDLVVWNAPKVWNDATDTEISNPTQSVKVHLDSVASKVVVYDPLGGTTPIATYTNVQDIVLPISDHPLIVEIGGTGLMAPAPVVTPANVSGTAASIVAQFDTLKESTTLQKITLTDTKVLPVASVSTMQFLIANDQSVLSKIVGDYQFSITQTAPTWQKSDVYDASGKLFSTTNAGIKDGIVFTQQTKYADGTLDTTNFNKGVKSNEIINHADGSKEVYNYNIKGQDYTTEHSSYSKAGALLTFERTHADGTLAFTEVNAGGVKTASWYDAKGVITKQAAYLTDGSIATSTYTNGAKDRMYVSHADKTQDNYSYGIKGQTYVTEQQSLDAKGKVVAVIRSHADGSTDYNWKLNGDGSTATTLYDAKGIKTTLIGVAKDGTRTTDLFASNGALTKEILQKADGYYGTTVYTNGVKSALYVVNGDTSKLTVLYATNGAKTSEVVTGIDGAVTTTSYTDGVKMRVFALHADKTQDNYAYNIKGQSYATEQQSLDAAGKVYAVIRTHADGTYDSTDILARDGTRTVTSYDGAGHKTSMVVKGTDGSVLTDLYSTAGAVTQETIQKTNGYQSIVNYTGGIKTSAYITNADGSKETDLYDAKGVITNMMRQAADGHTETSVYAGGVLSRLFVANSDGTGANTSYGIKGQSYVTEVQKLDKAGTVVEVIRSHANGSLDYHWTLGTDGTKTTTVYDATGHKLNTVEVGTDGHVLTDLYDAASGALTKEILQASNGDVTTNVYTSGVKTAVYAVHADGSKETDLYDSHGVITNMVRQGSDGHTETSVYANGELSRLFVKNADGTGANTSYDIQGKSYTTEMQKLDASGKVVEVVRSHDDGSLDYHWALSSNGTKTTTTYDSSGTKLTDVFQYSNGASDVFKFVMSGQPGVSQHESYNSSNALTLLDITNADGTHNVTAKAGGVTATGGNGNDTVSLYGNDTFVFTHGNDKISNFHADESASNHDLIQISKSLASSFAALQVSQVGADTLVTINSHDSILLKGIDHGHVTAGDFLFA